MSIVSRQALDCHEPSLSNKQVALALAASCAGWSLDLFDLFLLLYVAPYVSKAFFPSQDQTLALAAVYASFAVTLFMRPIGSAVFGSYADKHGRKGAMMLAMTGVGLSTAAFGLIPGYQQIGSFAPGIFLLLRLVQGVFVGGVVASTHTIGTESVPRQWRGITSGLVGGGGAGLGALLASLVFFIASLIFTGDAFAVWGWRAMFFSGILSSALGLGLFRALEESPLWAKLKSAHQDAGADPQASSPLRTLFSKAHRKTFLLNLLVTFGGGAGYYATSGYMPTYLRVVNHVPNRTASILLVAAGVASIAAGLIFGQLADSIGRKKTFTLIGLLSIVIVPWSFLRLAGSFDMASITVYSLLIAFLGNAALAPIPIFLNERFPTAIRASGTGLSWNIGFALGGTVPFFITLSSGSLHRLPLTLAIFSIVIFAVYLLGTLASGESKGQNM